MEAEKEKWEKENKPRSSKHSKTNDTPVKVTKS